MLLLLLSFLGFTPLSTAEVLLFSNADQPWLYLQEDNCVPLLLVEKYKKLLSDTLFQRLGNSLFKYLRENIRGVCAGCEGATAVLH